MSEQTNPRPPHLRRLGRVRRGLGLGSLTPRQSLMVITPIIVESMTLNFLGALAALIVLGPALLVVAAAFARWEGDWAVERANARLQWAHTASEPATTLPGRRRSGTPRHARRPRGHRASQLRRLKRRPLHRPVEPI